MIELRNLIDGELVPARTDATLDNVEPATGRVYSTVPDSDDSDVANAVDAAQRAFPAWAATPAEERARLLLKLTELIKRDHEKLARAETIDNGKPIALSRTVDIPRAASNFRFFATAILHSHNESYETLLPNGERAINCVQHHPRGVVGAISPWNLPLYLFSWKIAPALATGNTVVGKPSEVTPMTAFLLSELAIEAGLPKGVLNIIHGRGPSAGGPIITHPNVPTITFTGGTATGQWIAREAGPMFKRMSLELGGKNPNIIFADADYARALSETLRSSFANQGQICLCGSRIFIERPIYDRFVDDLTNRAAALAVGDPLEESTKQGAVVSQTHMNKILGCIEFAKEEGGTILCGGERADPPNERCAGGFFIQPTIIADLPHDCRTNQEEIFGPAVTVMPFDDEDEVIGWANSTDYGLSATLWTQNLSRAHRVASRIDSGTVWVNCWLLRDLRVPFGGMKQSGIGREGGEEALRFFTEPRTVCVRL
jgi:aminomuconate-semialdehyde/2-hydroxymuconate-6-semialdehyde dehydrogenase